MNTSIKYLLERKGHDIWSTSSDETVDIAIQLMADKDVGA